MSIPGPSDVFKLFNTVADNPETIIINIHIDAAMAANQSNDGLGVCLPTYLGDAAAPGHPRRRIRRFPVDCIQHYLNLLDAFLLFE